MLGMDRIYVIRHKWHHEGLSIRRIARDLGVSRNTVRKYVDAEGEPQRREAGKRPQPVLAKVRERIDEIVREWGQRTTSKQRITGTLVHQQMHLSETARMPGISSSLLPGSTALVFAPPEAREPTAETGQTGDRDAMATAQDSAIGGPHNATAMETTAVRSPYTLSNSITY